MLVDKVVSNDATEPDEVDFFKEFSVSGNWNTNKCVYTCTNLDLSNRDVENCPGYDAADNKIKISNNPKYVEIREVKVIPNNKNSNSDISLSPW